MSKNLVAGLVIFIISYVSVSETFAQSVTARVNQRKGAMSLQHKYLAPLVNIAQEKAPFDAALIQRNVDILALITTLPWDDFHESTAQAPNTRAKDDIYKDAPKFKAGIDKLHGEMKVLVSASRTGNQATIGNAVRNVAMACNSCHDAFSTWNPRYRFE